eukprot:tig00021244_g19570.t1
MEKPTAPGHDRRFTNYWEFSTSKVRSVMKLLVAAGNKWYQKCGFDKLDDAYWDEVTAKETTWKQELAEEELRDRTPAPPRVARKRGRQPHVPGTGESVDLTAVPHAATGTEPAISDEEAEVSEEPETRPSDLVDLDKLAQINNKDVDEFVQLARATAHDVDTEAAVYSDPTGFDMPQQPATPAVVQSEYHHRLIDVATAFGEDVAERTRTLPILDRVHLNFSKGRHGRIGDPADPLDQRKVPLSISKYNKWFLLSDKARALVADIGFFFVQATDYLNLKAYQKSNCAIQSLELDKLEAAGHPVTAAHVMDHLTTAVDDPSVTVDFVKRHLVRATLNAIWYTMSFNDHGDASLYRAIDRERFHNQAAIDALSANEKDTILNSESGIVVRHYQRRWNALIKLMYSEGARAMFGGYKMTGHFIRHGEQQRRTLHGHLIGWCEGMPMYDTCEKQHMKEYLEFFDSIVKAEILDLRSPTTQPSRTTFTGTCRMTKAKQAQHYSSSTRKRHEELFAAAAQFKPTQEYTNPLLEGCQPIHGASDKDAQELADLVKKLNNAWWRARKWSTPELKNAQRGDRLLVPMRRTVEDLFVALFNEWLSRIAHSNLFFDLVADFEAMGAYMFKYALKVEPQALESIYAALAKAAEKGGTLRSAMAKAIRKSLSHRELGRPEAAFHMLNYPIWHSSFHARTVPCIPPDKRTRRSYQRGFMRPIRNRNPGEILILPRHGRD